MKVAFTRRAFLRRTSSAAALLGFPTLIPSRALGAGAPSRVLHIAQIGCGRIAHDMDIPGVLKHPQLARIVAVADFDQQRAELARRQIAGSYEKSLSLKLEPDIHRDYHELLQRPDIDAVMISTPDHWHAQPVIEAALAGKDVYVQKPLSLTVAEGRLAADVVHSKGRILQIGSQQRSTAQFHRACELVRNGVLGRLKAVRIGLPIDPAGGRASPMPVPATLNYDAWLGSTPSAPYTEDRVHPQSHDPRKTFDRPGWLRLNAHTCGMITGWGSHHVDITHWGLGTELSGPVSISAKAEWPGTDSFWDVHGKYEVQLVYPGNVAVTISNALPNGVRFEGESGWIWVTRGSATSPQSLNASDPALLSFRESDRKVQLHRSPNWDHHLDWIEALRSRKEAVTNAETGHRSCSACILSWIGMKLGRPLHWDSTREQFVDDAEANRMLDRPERAPYGAFRAASNAGFKAFKSLRNV